MTLSDMSTQPQKTTIGRLHRGSRQSSKERFQSRHDATQIKYHSPERKVNFENFARHPANANNKNTKSTKGDRKYLSSLRPKLTDTFSTLKSKFTKTQSQPLTTLENHGILIRWADHYNKMYFQTMEKLSENYMQLLREQRNNTINAYSRQHKKMCKQEPKTRFNDYSKHNKERRRPIRSDSYIYYKM